MWRMLEDAGLMVITSCAKASVTTEAGNVGNALAKLGKLIGIFIMFRGVFGAPLSNLAGPSSRRAARRESPPPAHRGASARASSEEL